MQDETFSLPLAKIRVQQLSISAVPRSPYFKDQDSGFRSRSYQDSFLWLSPSPRQIEELFLLLVILKDI